MCRSEASIYGFPEASAFTPISELNRTDADVELLFLGQEKLQYTAPVHDPWFEALEPDTIMKPSAHSDLENITIYNAEWPVSTVGCAVQYQFCDPSIGTEANCTGMTGIDAVFPKARELLRKNPKQYLTLQRLQQLLGSIGGLSRLTQYLAGNVLLANKYGTIEMTPFPNDQWIQELNHMFGTVMTVLQIRNYRFVGGYAEQYVPAVTPPRDNETWMCDNQMIRREDYQSFSILGLSIIIGMGSLIILINMTLDVIVAWYQKQSRTRTHAYMEWDILETEELQRLVYSKHGVDMLSGSSSIEQLLKAEKSSTPEEINSTPEKPPSVQEQRVENILDNGEEGSNRYSHSSTDNNEVQPVVEDPRTRNI